ncbi:MAG: flagellar protein FliS [Anaerolineaceae bacterium]|nr:flagellar protein FliS [Anaerolineaceae bacterium]
MRTSYGASQYKKMDVEGASPIRLVVMAYDLAILSCDKEDFETAAKAVGALKNSLDFDYPEASGGLLAVYNWALELLRKNDFSSAKNILLELREAWAVIEKRLNIASQVQVTETGGLLFDDEVQK